MLHPLHIELGYSIIYLFFYWYLQELLKLQKHKMQLQQQQVATAVGAAAAAAQGQQAPGAQQVTQVQPAQATLTSPQLTVATPRAGAVLANNSMANLQVARLVRFKNKSYDYANN